ncbi:hypothetical protein EVAR_28611_1 [Eumeta japonica]|uniref:Uncharacterized protein n=1 Tax=Eumeta variegata TaxID=151549 RepID=A0A4C1XVU4_EUMVA|nr:hypothetical protein EVAR_28611_1 [Eumeta japonica]
MELKNINYTSNPNKGFGGANTAVMGERDGSRRGCWRGGTRRCGRPGLMVIDSGGEEKLEVIFSKGFLHEPTVLTHDSNDGYRNCSKKIKTGSGPEIENQCRVRTRIKVNTESRLTLIDVKDEGTHSISMLVELRALTTRTSDP